MKLARDILQAKGYATLEAVTGDDGVRLGQQHLPELVLMDIQLPDIDGIEALRQLRADPRTAAIPVIAVTASVMPVDRSKITDAGFDGFPRQADRAEGIPRHGEAADRGPRR